MKTVAATQARKEFFSLLDRAVGGETIIIKRNGVSLRLVPNLSPENSARTIDYRNYIQGSVDFADAWKWDWTTSGKLKLKK